MVSNVELSRIQFRHTPRCLLTPAMLTTDAEPSITRCSPLWTFGYPGPFSRPLIVSSTQANQVASRHGLMTGVVSSSAPPSPQQSLAQCITNQAHIAAVLLCVQQTPSG